MLSETLSIASADAGRDRIAEADIARYQAAFAPHTPQDLLAWALGRFGRRIAVVTALQDEGIVLLDMARKIAPDVRAITIDTGRLPNETYRFIETVRERLDVTVEIVHPDARSLAALVGEQGPNLFYRSVDARLSCCRVRKVEPLRRALGGMDAWITGLRRDQTPDRAATPILARDDAHGGVLKLAPLAAWSLDDVAVYLRAHDLPRHPLYARGYRSIGCAPCTRPVQIGEPARAGRWWWEQGTHKECGLHLPTATTAAPSAAGGAA